MIGTSFSIIASILIAHVLYEVYTGSIGAAFQPPALYSMIALILVGIGALYGYLGYSEISLWHMKHLSPIALILGAVSIVVGVKVGPKEGGALIVLTYIVELSVAWNLAKDYSKESKIGSTLFIAGVTIFLVSLPFVIINKAIALVPLVGDIIKLAGLLLVLQGITGGGGALKN